MIDRISGIFKGRQVLKSLIIKNVKAKYAGSTLGILWTFINPALLALVIFFIFTQIIRVNIRHFYLFIISGLLPWSFFACSLQETCSSIVTNANVLKQFPVPREFIPISVVCANFFAFILGLLVMLPFFALLNKEVVFMLPLLLPLVFMHLVFTIGIALILSAVYVYLRDIAQILSVLLIFWLWLTPVFYSVEMIPDKYKALFILNPMTVYISLYRGILFNVESFRFALIPFAAAISLISFILGYVIFTRNEASFLKRI